MSDLTAGTVRWQRLVIILILGMVFVVIARGVLAIPENILGVAPHITSNLTVSGVVNPVTAVLLNFRGYDTLLEIGVLMLATIGVLSLARNLSLAQMRFSPPADPVLALMTRISVPLLVLISGYLLWAGEKAPGGAFQAGSVLGAAGVLLALSGHTRPAWLNVSMLRVSIAAGFIVFLLAAIVPMFLGKNLLEYPVALAKTLIIVIETWLTLSIGFMLVSMFIASAAPISRSPEGSIDAEPD